MLPSEFEGSFFTFFSHSSTYVSEINSCSECKWDLCISGLLQKGMFIHFSIILYPILGLGWQNNLLQQLKNHRHFLLKQCSFTGQAMLLYQLFNLRWKLVRMVIEIPTVFIHVHWLFYKKKTVCAYTYVEVRHITSWRLNLKAESSCKHLRCSSGFGN